MREHPEGQQRQIEGPGLVGGQLVRVISPNDQPFGAHEFAETLRQRLAGDRADVEGQAARAVQLQERQGVAPRAGADVEKAPARGQATLHYP